MPVNGIIMTGISDCYVYEVMDMTGRRIILMLGVYAFLTALFLFADVFYGITDLSNLRAALVYSPLLLFNDFGSTSNGLGYRYSCISRLHGAGSKLLRSRGNLFSTLGYFTEEGIYGFGHFEESTLHITELITTGRGLPLNYEITGLKAITGLNHFRKWSLNFLDNIKAYEQQ